MITRIDVDNAQVLQSLEKLAAANADFTPLMREVAGLLFDAVEENFAQQGRPRWQPLKASTVAKRGSSQPILQVSGQLAASLSQDHDATSAVVGTNKEYAATHQFGAAKGSFAQKPTKSGASINIPWGDIPARPFLALTEEDHAQLVELAIDYERGAAGL